VIPQIPIAVVSNYLTRFLFRCFPTFRFLILQGAFHPAVRSEPYISIAAAFRSLRFIFGVKQSGNYIIFSFSSQGCQSTIRRRCRKTDRGILCALQADPYSAFS
jgi:hypothetical protein